MSYLAEQIEKNCAPSQESDSIVVYKTGSHSGYKTYDGIDVNGKRVSDEILAETLRLESLGHNVTKFSLIGYSMGGLVSRYAIGILYRHKYFESVQPIHFVTFCTPHVGSINTNNSTSAKLFNLVAPHVLVYTGKQMFLQDKTPANGNDDKLPLLVWMADSNSPFYKALASFTHRSLYANAINDRRTSWYTTYVTHTDPFDLMVTESFSAYELKYIKGYEPNVIDFSKSVDFKRIVHETGRKSFSFVRLAYKCIAWLKVLTGLIFITPVYSIYVLSNAVWQRVKLIFRLRSFHKDHSNRLDDLYELGFDHTMSSSREGEKSISIEEYEQVNKPGDEYRESYMEALEDKIHDRAELFVDSILNAVNTSKYTDYHESVLKKPKSGYQSGSESDSLLGKPDLVNLRGKAIKDEFRIKTNEKQERIIRGLNLLSWNKFPVIIRNTKATHAAVIYRHPDPDFVEGKTIVRHFIEQIFKI